MTGEVWVSAACSNTALYKPFQAEVTATDPKREGALRSRHQAYEAILPDEFPNRFFGSLSDKWHGRQADFFAAGGWWCVSAASAEVLRRFDLGTGGLLPVQLFQHDRVTPVKGDYYGLNFGASKRAVIPSKSKLRRNEFTPDLPVRYLNLQPADGDVALTSAAMAGADLWTDPQVSHVFFISGLLTDALRAIGVLEGLALTRCRVANLNGDEP